MKRVQSCISPAGHFLYSIHKPAYCAANLRTDSYISPLGQREDGSVVDNSANFPHDDVQVAEAGWVYEIINPLPFRGTTFIDKGWADAVASGRRSIALPSPPQLSFSNCLRTQDISPQLIGTLPRPLQLALAVCSTDPEDLIALAGQCCELLLDDNGDALGLRYHTTANGHTEPVISDAELFEAVANNADLPASYKQAMVLRPGAQGHSEIVGSWPQDGFTHVYEYLRRNSYIAGGHYAANMAEDAIRYSIADLSAADVHALRHLYYQRSYHRLASDLGLTALPEGHCSERQLEELRQRLARAIDTAATSAETAAGATHGATLWGWNFGFDYTPTDYRLHASHQQIHQQYALIPDTLPTYGPTPESPCGTRPAFCCGDLIADAVTDYIDLHQRHLFLDYLTALRHNSRMDGRKDLPQSLMVWENEHVLLFVPKAQTSQWELQIMTKPDATGCFPGNIIETDAASRRSLDTALLIAQKVLAGLGARMVTTIEFSKRFGSQVKQPLLYALLPKIPYSMGGFSEAQLRFICGHYPEDFAAACRSHLPPASTTI